MTNNNTTIIDRNTTYINISFVCSIDIYKIIQHIYNILLNESKDIQSPNDNYKQNIVNNKNLYSTMLYTMSEFLQKISGLICLHTK